MRYKILTSCVIYSLCMHVVDIGYQNVFSILFFFEALTVTGVFRGIYGLNLPKSLHCSNEVVQITVQELS